MMSMIHLTMDEWTPTNGGLSAVATPWFPNISSFFVRNKFNDIVQRTQCNVQIKIIQWTYNARTKQVTSQEESIKTGSGVIIHKEGRILTNAHVVDEPNKPGVQKIVILQDGRQYDYLEELLDRDSDLATIRIQEKNLPVATFGKSSDTHVGDNVVAVGCPNSLSHTYTFGKVSHSDRLPTEIPGHPHTTVPSYIQTDAAINQGNSGGGLYDEHGVLIGINTRSYLNLDGISFAIPIDYVIDDFLPKLPSFIS